MSQQTNTEAQRVLPDPVELASRYAEVARRASKLMARHVEKQSKNGFPVSHYRHLQSVIGQQIRLLDER